MQTDFSKISPSLTAYLQEKEIHAVDAWGEKMDCCHGVVVVSLEQCQVDSAGMGDYLGQMVVDEDSVELYGKRCMVSFGLNIFAPPRGGEQVIQTCLNQVLTALSQTEGSGFRMREFSAEASGLDTVTGLLKRKVTIQSQIYLYYEQGSGEPFMDFNIKGVLSNASK